MKTALVLLVPVAFWGTSVVIWRWVVGRLALGRSPDAELGERERLVHRNLRRLLAFNFLVMYPVGIPAGTALLIWGGPGVVEPAVGMLAGVVVFSAPLLSLASSAKELKRQRLSGAVPQDQPSIWLDDADAVVGTARSKGNTGEVIGVVVFVLAGGCYLFTRNTPFSWAGMLLAALGVVVYEVSRRRRG